MHMYLYIRFIVHLFGRVHICALPSIYIYIYIYIYTYIYIYIYIYVCMYVCVYIYMYICVCVYIYIYILDTFAETHFPQQPHGFNSGSARCTIGSWRQAAVARELSVTFIFLDVAPMSAAAMWDCCQCWDCMQLVLSRHCCPATLLPRRVVCLQFACRHALAPGSGSFFEAFSDAAAAYYRAFCCFHAWFILAEPFPKHAQADFRTMRPGGALCLSTGAPRRKQQRGYKEALPKATSEPPELQLAHNALLHATKLHSSRSHLRSAYVPAHSLGRLVFYPWALSGHTTPCVSGPGQQVWFSKRRLTII